MPKLDKLVGVHKQKMIVLKTTLGVDSARLGSRLDLPVERSQAMLWLATGLVLNSISIRNTIQ